MPARACASSGTARLSTSSRPSLRTSRARPGASLGVADGCARGRHDRPLERAEGAPLPGRGRGRAAAVPAEGTCRDRRRRRPDGCAESAGGVPGLPPAITFAGHRADVPALLGAIDVFAISLHLRGHAARAVRGDGRGQGDRLDGGGRLPRGAGGRRHRPARAAPRRRALAAALGRVVDDPALRRSLADNARKASTRYDIRTCVAGMEALYDEVLAERGIARALAGARRRPCR